MIVIGSCGAGVISSGEVTERGKKLRRPILPPWTSIGDFFDKSINWSEKICTVFIRPRR